MAELTEKCSSSNCRQKEKDSLEENTQTCINGNKMLPEHLQGSLSYTKICGTSVHIPFMDSVD